MKKFKNIKSWLDSNPSTEEQTKVLNLIHKGEFNQTRKEIWTKESYLRKLQGMVRYFDKLEMKPPKDITDKIMVVTSEILTLKKDLPAPVVRAIRIKKEEVVVEK